MNNNLLWGWQIIKIHKRSSKGVTQGQSVKYHSEVSADFSKMGLQLVESEGMYVSVTLIIASKLLSSNICLIQRWPIAVNRLDESTTYTSHDFDQCSLYQIKQPGENTITNRISIWTQQFAHKMTMWNNVRPQKGSLAEMVNSTLHKPREAKQ